MSLSSLLVHLDDGASCPGRVDAALSIARRFDARLIGAYLVPTIDVASTVASLVPEALMQRRVREAFDAQGSAERLFRAAAVALPYERIEWRAPAGDPLEAALAHARSADLFVLGQRDAREGGADFVADLTSTVLLGSGHPILVIPYIGAPATIGNNVLIATEGGREASRAISDALPFIERAEWVTLLIGTREGHRDDFEQTRARLSTWFGDHDIGCNAELFDVAANVVGESLLSRASDLGSDLIVMGGYGQARLRQLILGGTTHTILDSMTVPVLMSH